LWILIGILTRIKFEFSSLSRSQGTLVCEPPGSLFFVPSHVYFYHAGPPNS
jgi:hypothetical protein